MDWLYSLPFFIVIALVAYTWVRKYVQDKWNKKMAISVSQNPEAVSLAGNPILFEITADAGWGSLSFYGIHIQVKRTSDDSNIGGEQRFTPDSNGKVLIDVSEILQREIADILTWPEEIGTYLVDRDDLRLQFYISATAKSGNPLSAGSTIDSSDYYVLPGGVSKTLLAMWNDQDTSFYDEYIQNGRFLTSGPRVRSIDKNQPERLYFYNNSGKIQARLVMKLYYTDDSTEEVTRETDASADSVYEIICGYFDLEILQGTEVSRYEVWIEGSNDGSTWEVISEVKEFVVDTSEYDTVRYFLFENNFGVWECFKTTGRVDQGYELSQDTTTGILDYGFVLTDRQLKRVVVNEFRKYSISTGWMRKLMFSHISQAFASEKVFILDGENLLPVRFSNTNYGETTSDANLVSYQIEFIMGYPDKYQVGSSGLTDPDSFARYWADMGQQDSVTASLISLCYAGKGLVFAGLGPTNPAKIMRSLDYGRSFSLKGTIYAGDAGTESIIFSKGRLIALTEDGTGDKIYVSDDLGETWTQKHVCTVGAYSLFDAGGGLLLCAIAFSWVTGMSFLKSTDNGDTWTKVNYGDASFHSGTGYCFVKNVDGTISYIANGLVILGNSDLTTWEVLNNTKSFKYAVGIGSKIYAVATRTLYVSEDKGATWEELATADISPTVFQGIEYIDTGKILLTTNTASLYLYSSDKGIIELVLSQYAGSLIKIEENIVLAGGGSGKVYRSVPNLI